MHTNTHTKELRRAENFVEGAGKLVPQGTMTQEKAKACTSEA